MIIRKAMYGCGLYFFIKLAYNSPILCKFAIAFFIGTVQQTSQSTLGLFRDSEFGNTFMVLYKMARLLFAGC